MVNKENFLNQVEFLESDFQEFVKANPSVMILTIENYGRFLTDANDKLIKAQDNEDLKTELSKSITDQLQGLLKVDLMKANGTRSRVYVYVPSMVGDDGIFGDNIITKAIGMSGHNISGYIYKGSRDEIGAIREWKGQPFEKGENGWKPLREEPIEE